MSATLFRRSVEVFIDRKLSPEARSKHLASVARAGLADILKEKSVQNYIRFVDGVQDVSEDQVKAEGVIVYRFSILPLIVGFLLGYLRQRSPVRSGRFRDSFWVAVNGRLIPARDFRPEKVPMSAEIYIGNSVPYNRRVDVQRDGTKPLRFSVPPNLYADGVVAARKRFGGLINLYRVYTVEFPGQYILKTGPRTGKRVHSPAIHITLRD